MQAADENQVMAGCTGPIAERHGEAAMVELETLDILQTLIYHTDASKLPEPNELARLLDRLRSNGVRSQDQGWLAQLTEAVEQAAHCWQHGFIAGHVAYAEPTSCRRGRVAWRSRPGLSVIVTPTALRTFSGGGT
jgi:hypothetical protein